MSKAIITVVGRDTVGIIARVCTYMAGEKINIEDISQAIVAGYFNMMMVVDTSACEKPLGEVITDLTAVGEELGVVIHCQSEDLFTRMHRI